MCARVCETEGERVCKREAAHLYVCVLTTCVQQEHGVLTVQGLCGAVGALLGQLLAHLHIDAV